MGTLICSGGARRSTIIAIQKPLYIEEIRKSKITQNTENKLNKGGDIYVHKNYYRLLAI